MGKDTAQARRDLQSPSVLVREAAAQVLVEDQLNMCDVFGTGFNYDRTAGHELNRARVAARVARLNDATIPEIDGVPAHLLFIVDTVQIYGIDNLIRVELHTHNKNFPLQVFCHPDPDDANLPTQFGVGLDYMGLKGAPEAIQWWCCEEVNRLVSLYHGTDKDKALYAEVLDAARATAYAKDFEDEA